MKKFYGELFILIGVTLIIGMMLKEYLYCQSINKDYDAEFGTCRGRIYVGRE